MSAATHPEMLRERVDERTVEEPLQFRRALSGYRCTTDVHSGACGDELTPVRSFKAGRDRLFQISLFAAGRGLPCGFLRYELSQLDGDDDNDDDDEIGDEEKPRTGLALAAWLSPRHPPSTT